MITEDYSKTRFSAFGGIIRRDWGSFQINFGAKPYLEAMEQMTELDDMVGMDTGREIVLRFLSNASTWRGPIARAVKAELKRRLSL